MTNTTESTDTPRLSFLDRQKEAALAVLSEQAAERRRVADITLGKNSRDRVTEVINLSGDYLVEVTTPDSGVYWTFVVAGKRGIQLHTRQEDAILHLIAARYDPNPNTNGGAAFYAGRVLGLPSA